ncbi:MAG TPA: PAS domain-containing protein [Pyrinomonadaceae bacterium]|nr:PAS domain-containing protein [Pyrinomonadaceae bacterium]
MAELPAPIRDFIDTLTDELLAPAYMLVGDEGGLAAWGGALDSYGISGLDEDMQVGDHLPFLAGVLPVDAGGVFLPHVQIRSDVYADVYFFHRPQGTWILLLDATANVKTKQTLQQRAYDVSLHAADLEQEGKALYDVNSMLEQRVGEQTAELSQTVVRLQQELAETKRTHRELTTSESRFKSLYHSNLIGIVFWDPSGTITGANDFFLQLIGFSKTDLSRRIITWSLISPEESMSGGEVLEPSLEAPDSGSGERHFVRKDGTRTKLLFLTGPYDESAKRNVGFASRP